jgi:hypothetical protein
MAMLVLIVGPAILGQFDHFEPATIEKLITQSAMTIIGLFLVLTGISLALWLLIGAFTGMARGSTAALTGGMAIPFAFSLVTLVFPVYLVGALFGVIYLLPHFFLIVLILPYVLFAGLAIGSSAAGGGLGMVGGVAVAMFSGLAIASFSGVYEGLMNGLSEAGAAGFTLAIGWDIAKGVAKLVSQTSVFWIVMAVGALRIPFYLVEVTDLARVIQRSRRFQHPIWWDELAILPFIGSDKIITRAWRHGEDEGLTRLVRLAANPFQRWVLQRALTQYLQTTHYPIHFIYNMLRHKSLEAFAIAPISRSDWEQIPSARQVFLSELAGLGTETSRGLEKVVCLLTRPFRISSTTPLTDLVRTLHEISNSQEPTNSSYNIKSLKIKDSSSEFFQQLLNYPGGKELKSSFGCIYHGLQVSSITDLIHTSSLLHDLPPAQEAIRPEVIEALQLLGQISKDISVAQAASSRLNQLAAVARATVALEELGPYIEQKVVEPEKVLLLKIRSHWRTLVAEAGGRLGQQVQYKRVVNPYVAGNPVVGGLFVGRDGILDQLEELWLKPGQVDSVVLYGHRRMGKSSILKNLPKRLDPSFNLVVDFNMQKIGKVRNTGELLYALALEMHDHLPKSSLVIAPPDEQAFHASYNFAFNRWLKLIAPLAENHRFIVAIDEYELLEAAMAEGRIDQGLTDYLRGVIQSTDWFVLVLAGLYTLQEKCHDYWNPLFASIKTRKVSFLSPAATRLLLTQPSDDFPLNYTQATIEEVVKLTNGQPYLVQLIGQNLVTQFNRRLFEEGQDPDKPLSLDDLHAVIDSAEFFEDGSPYFNGIWRQAEDPPNGQQAILQALAQGYQDLWQLISASGLPAADARSALQTLEGHDVITQTDEQLYGFSVELMRRWVQQRQSHL